MTSLKTITVLVDERPVVTQLGFTIMQTCSNVGIDIPRFCYHDKLLIAGNCRICLVEVTGSKKLVAACAVHASDGLSVFTNTVRVRLARQNVLEFLLANHPLDCPICDQGGECDLQDITALFGADRGRFYEIEKRAVLNKDFGPLIRTSMNRCIHCTRCVRFLAMSTGGSSSLGTLGRGSSTEIGTYIGQFISDELSGNITDLCPVGALTSKPYSFQARPWELVSVKGVDIFDSLNSSLYFDVMSNKICRVLPYANDRLNECWLTNKARYAYDGLFVQRLDSCSITISEWRLALVRDPLNPRWTAIIRPTFYTTRVTFDWAIRYSAYILFYTDLQTNLLFVVAPTVDLQATFHLKYFANFIGGGELLLDNWMASTPIFADHNFLYLFNTSLVKLAKLPSFCLFLGTNLRLEVPLLNLRLNYLVSERGTPLYKIGGSASYMTYKLRLISTNMRTFYAICEFRHIFCKNFYNPLFAYRPFILVSGTLFAKRGGELLPLAVISFVRRILKFSSANILARWNATNEFSYFGFVYQHSAPIHLRDSGFVTPVNRHYFDALRKQRFFEDPYYLGNVRFQVYQFLPLQAYYVIGGSSFETETLFSIDPGSKKIYQGSHPAKGWESYNVMLATTTNVERSTTYRNLLGDAQTSEPVVNYDFGINTDQTVFSAFIKLLSEEISPSWFAFSYKNSLMFNFTLLVSAEFLQNSNPYFTTTYSRFKLFCSDNSENSSNFSLSYTGSLSYLLVYNAKLSSVFLETTELNSSVKTISRGRIFSNWIPSSAIRYYADDSSTVLTFSKTTGLCAAISATKSPSFSSFYY